MELVDSVPAPAPTPSPEVPVEPVVEPVPEITPEPETPVAPSEPASELFKLPDGREVDAAGLKREYENLLPEFTRKSQRLAELERTNEPNLNNPQLPKWKEQGYVPQTYAELIEYGKQAALEELQTQARAAEEARTQVATQVDQEIVAIKAKDPKLDENALFVHANKYGFNNLVAAYENMTAMRKMALETEQRVLKNVQTRQNDPVAGGGTPQPAVGNAVPYNPHGQYGSALEYFRSKSS